MTPDMPILDIRKHTELDGISQLDIVLQLLSLIVEERKAIRETQKQGIELGKQQGKYKGRKVKYHAKNFVVLFNFKSNLLRLPSFKKQI